MKKRILIAILYGWANYGLLSHKLTVCFIFSIKHL